MGFFVYEMSVTCEKPLSIKDIRMNNTGWMIFLGIFLTSIGLDVYFTQSFYSIFLLKEFAKLIEWIAFWR
jgi:hypothetical protein